MFGFDYRVTDNIGAFMEGGYCVASEDDTEGSGALTDRRARLLNPRAPVEHLARELVTAAELREIA